MDSSRFFHPYAARTAARDERIAQAKAVCNICPALMACLAHALIPGLCERGTGCAIWSVRLAPAVLLMRPPMMPRRCRVTQHVSKTNQPLESLHRPSSIPVHQPPPGEWPAPIRDSTIHPEQLLPQRLPWCRRHRLVGVDRTGAATSPPPAWPEFCPVTVIDIDIPPERNTVLPMPLAGADGMPYALAVGAVQSPFESTPDQIPRWCVPAE
jgi:hypothetical protein